MYELIYVSTLAAGVPVSVVAKIAQESRRFNVANGITGLLVFDGMRFCQQLEGSLKQVLSLFDRIREDPRHTRLEVVHHGALAQRRFNHFSLAYTTADDETALAELETLVDGAAVAAFVKLLDTLDLPPGSTVADLYSAQRCERLG